MVRSHRLALALAAALAGGCALSACGDSVPSNAIATVNGVVITKASFQHWLTVAEHAATGSTSGGPVAPLDPPNYTACIAWHRKNDPKPAKGQAPPTAATLKSECAQLYQAAEQQVVPFLITADWLQGEAADEGVKATPAEVQQMLKALESQTFRTPAQLQQYLTSHGETNADLLFRERIDVLSDKLRTKVTSAKITVTPAQIAAYYNKNISMFGTPEKRDVRIILVKTQAEANRIRQEIIAGQSMTKLARQDSIDPATKSKGGALIGLQKGQSDSPALDAAIFSAKLGQLGGPVQTAFGWELFRVGKITPGTKQTLAQATPLIRQLVTAQDQQNALTSFVNKFESKWRSRTVCAKGFIVSDCKNGPKLSPTTTPSSTATTPSSSTTGGTSTGTAQGTTSGSTPGTTTG